MAAVIADWTAWLYSELAAIHHFEVPAGSAIYRAFLLPDGLELDLGFAPAAGFGPLGDADFELVFGQPADRVAGHADVNHLVGLGWHHALHARAAIERELPWAAEHWITALRNHAIALTCIRHGLPSGYAKGADRLPDAQRQALADGFVRDLDPAELRRARAVVLPMFLVEVRHIDAVLADQLAGTF